MFIIIKIILRIKKTKTQDHKGAVSIKANCSHFTNIITAHTASDTMDVVTEEILKREFVHVNL
jgi:hypothetical protein